MNLYAGQTIAGKFFVTNISNGALQNADSTPAASLQLSTGINTALTVANITTGQYNYSGTVPTIVLGTTGQVIADVTIGGNRTARDVTPRAAADFKLSGGLVVGVDSSTAAATAQNNAALAGFAANIMVSENQFAVQALPSPTSTQFNISGGSHDIFSDNLLCVYGASTGNNGLAKRVQSYNSTSGVVTLATPLIAAPGVGDTFVRILAASFGTLASSQAFTNSNSASGISGPDAFIINWQDSSGNPVTNINFQIVGYGAINTGNTGSYNASGASGPYQINTYQNGLIFFPNAAMTLPQVGGPLVITGSSVQFPSNPPGTVTGSILALNQATPVAGAVFTFQITENDNGDDVSDSSTPFYSPPTNASGGSFVSFPENRKCIVARGMYNLQQLQTGRFPKVEFSTGTTNFAVPSVIGP